MSAFTPLLVPQQFPVRQETANRLNQQQHAAATHQATHCVIVAGAGTGKTHTLVHRAAHLLADPADPVLPYQICCLTFTNKAAAEIKHRLCNLVEGGGLISAGTYHAFAARLLHKHGHLIGLDGLRIIDSAESSSLIAFLRAELHLTLPPGVTSRHVLDLISYADNTSQELHLVLQHKGFAVEVIGKILQLQEHYQLYKQDHSLADYDDLLYHLLTLLADHGKQVIGHLKHVFADEVQDTNPLQLQVLLALLNHGALLTAVGDPAQAIYGFRGAKPAVMQELAEIPGCVTLHLGDNYRSHTGITGYANRVIAQHSGSLGNPLRAFRSGAEPQLAIYPDEVAEARAVAARIQGLIRAGADPESVAVLYSSTPHGVGLQLELSRLGIKYVTRGGARVTDTAHAKDICALLRLAVCDDSLSLQRLLQHLPGIGPAKARSLAESGLDNAPVPAKALSRVQGLIVCIEAMRSAPPELAWSAAIAWYAPLITADHVRRDLEQIGQMLCSARSVKAWLDDMALQSLPDQGDSEGKVCLSTVHSAKGLEFVHVHVVGLAEGRFGSRSAAAAESRDALLRLYYVAVTRARDTLSLSCPLQYRMSDNSWRKSVASTLLP